MKTIKILGTGCTNCKIFEINVKKALEKSGIETRVEKVTEMEDIMAYEIMGMPGLVVNEKVVSSGKMLEVDEIIALLDNLNGNTQ